MPFKLTPEKEQELLVEYDDGWNINELSIIYRVSERTVYRILKRHDARRQKDRRKRFKAPQKPVRTVRTLLPCGTNAGYQRHRRAGEYPCTICLSAHSQNVKDAKKSRK